ncbi:hypothetical protein BH09PLA1_BH09PLA1_06310 [soil metagenome]
MKRLILQTLYVNVAIVVVGLVNSVLLSRALGPAGRGEIAAALLWPTMAVYLSSMGIISSSTYFSAVPNARPATVFSAAALMSIAQAIPAILVGYLLVPSLLSSQTPEVVHAARLFLVVIPIALVAQNGMGILQGTLRFREFNLVRLITPAGYLLGTVVLLGVHHLTLLSIVWMHLSLAFATLIVTGVALFRAGVRFFDRPPRGLSREMAIYGAKVHVGNVGALANQSLDQMIMAAWFPPMTLGLYVVAVSAAGISQSLSQAVRTIVTPSITQQAALVEQRSMLSRVFKQYALLALIGTPLLSCAIFFGIPIVFGHSFSGAVWPAEILLVSGLFLGAKEVLSGAAQAMKNPWLSSQAQIVGLVITVVTLYLFLPRYGIAGAAISTALASLTQFLVLLWGLHHSHQVSVASLLRFNRNDLKQTIAMVRRHSGLARAAAGPVGEQRTILD